MHAEILTDTQVEVLRAVAPFARDAGFYLSGGTAIALHLGHRRSIDFDWFAPLDFDPDALEERLLALLPSVTITSKEDGTLHALASGVQLSYLRYRYPFLQPVVRWAEFGCDLGSIPDLAAMKVAAVANRGSRKDFVDLYAMGVSGLTLPEMVLLYRRRFTDDDLAHVLRSLTYFNDAEREPMPEMLWPTAWDEMKSSVVRWAGDLK
jgi:hypothetical protein